RHRGKSPHQAAYFMRTLKMQQEAAVLASFFALAGLVPAEPSAAAGAALPDITRGHSLCTAFETYGIMTPTASSLSSTQSSLPAVWRGVISSGWGGAAIA